MNQNKKRETTLLFDIDNTLVNRDLSFKSYIRDFIKRFPEFFNGVDHNSAVEKIVKIDNRGLCDRKIFIEKILKLFPKILLTPEEFWKDHQKLPEFIKPDQNLQMMLKRLSINHTMAIISNGSGKMQREKLKNSGIDQFFKTCFISGETGWEKPDEKIFLNALTALKCSPENTVMIGDDMEKDIWGAKQLGIKTVWISKNRGSFIKSELKDKIESDIVIEDIYQLEEVLPCII